MYIFKRNVFVQCYTNLAIIDNDIEFTKKFIHITCMKRCTSCILDDSKEQPVERGMNTDCNISAKISEQL